MNKLSWQQLLVIVAAIVYLVLLFSFGYGLFTCMERLDGISPSDQDLSFFGVGLCGLPYLILVCSIVPFAHSAYKEFISYSVKEAPAAPRSQESDQAR